MCRNNFTILLKDFDLNWESQGFKARPEDIEKSPGRKHEFKSTVRILNFFCERWAQSRNILEMQNAIPSKLARTASRQILLQNQTGKRVFKNGRVVKENGQKSQKAYDEKKVKPRVEVTTGDTTTITHETNLN